MLRRQLIARAGPANVRPFQRSFSCTARRDVDIQSILPPPLPYDYDVDVVLSELKKPLQYHCAPTRAPRPNKRFTKTKVWRTGLGVFASFESASLMFCGLDMKLPLSMRRQKNPWWKRRPVPNPPGQPPMGPQWLMRQFSTSCPRLDEDGESRVDRLVTGAEQQEAAESAAGGGGSSTSRSVVDPQVQAEVMAGEVNSGLNISRYTLGGQGQQQQAGPGGNDGGFRIRRQSVKDVEKPFDRRPDQPPPRVRQVDARQDRPPPRERQVDTHPDRPAPRQRQADPRPDRPPPRERRSQQTRGPRERPSRPRGAPPAKPTTARFSGESGWDEDDDGLDWMVTDEGALDLEPTPYEPSFTLEQDLMSNVPATSLTKRGLAVSLHRVVGGVKNEENRSQWQKHDEMRERRFKRVVNGVYTSGGLGEAPRTVADVAKLMVRRNETYDESKANRMGSLLERRPGMEREARLAPPEETKKIEG